MIKNKMTRDLCELSIFAYDDNKETMKQKVNKLGYEVTNVFSVKEIDGIICESDDAIVLAFRGSESFTSCPRDWYTNFNIGKKRTGIGGIHSGFFNGVIDLHKNLKPYLDKHKPVYITGHSQGGALAAVYSAIYVSLVGDKSLIAVTFAQPRVGDKYFVRYCKDINLNLIRFENSNDIVAKLPLYNIMRYKHYQKEHIYFDRKGDIIFNPSTKISILDFIKDLFTRPLDIAMDHMTEDYKQLVFKHFK
jgi:triacylglycerol lipase